MYEETITSIILPITIIKAAATISVLLIKIISCKWTALRKNEMTKKNKITNNNY